MLSPIDGKSKNPATGIADKASRKAVKLAMENQKTDIAD
jgi:hypothetical protein